MTEIARIWSIDPVFVGYLVMIAGLVVSGLWLGGCAIWQGGAYVVRQVRQWRTRRYQRSIGLGVGQSRARMVEWPSRTAARRRVDSVESTARRQELSKLISRRRLELERDARQGQ